MTLTLYDNKEKQLLDKICGHLQYENTNIE